MRVNEVSFRVINVVENLEPDFSLLTVLIFAREVIAINPLRF